MKKILSILMASAALAPSPLIAGAQELEEEDWARNLIFCLNVY